MLQMSHTFAAVLAKTTVEIETRNTKKQLNFREQISVLGQKGVKPLTSIKTTSAYLR